MWLTRPGSEHALAQWLEDFYVVTAAGSRWQPQWKQSRRVKVAFEQLRLWYQTLDDLLAHKASIETAIWRQLRARRTSGGRLAAAPISRLAARRLVRWPPSGAPLGRLATSAPASPDGAPVDPGGPGGRRAFGGAGRGGDRTRPGAGRCAYRICGRAGTRATRYTTI